MTVDEEAMQVDQGGVPFHSGAGMTVASPSRHTQQPQKSRTRWMQLDKSANVSEGDLPGPANYKSKGTLKKGGTAFTKSDRADIWRFPSLGGMEMAQNVRANIDTVPASCEYGGLDKVQNRPLGGAFDTGERRSDVDIKVYNTKEVPGPGKYDVTKDAITRPVPHLGLFSSGNAPSEMDVVERRAKLTPGPTHAYRIPNEFVSTKKSEEVAFKFPGKSIWSNHETSLQNSVSFHHETMNQKGPNQCRSDSSLHEQYLSGHKSAPAFSFGAASRTIGAGQTHKSKSQKLVAAVGREAPRIQKKDDFERFFGYNPSASKKDLQQYYGFPQTLQQAHGCPSLRDEPGARQAVLKPPPNTKGAAQWKKRKKKQKKTILKKYVTPQPNSKSWQEEHSRSASFVRPAPTPGPGQYSTPSSFNYQLSSKNARSPAYGFGTD
jgi:hypothetical protein